VLEHLKPLEYFKEYLEYGCYPFILKKDSSYQNQLLMVVNQILEVDLPYITNINFSQIDKIKKLIYLLSISVPLKPNISKLSSATEISRPTLLEYIYYLEKGRLIARVNNKARGYNVLTKPDKLYIYNTNLAKAIATETKAGTLREIFFVNQIKSYFYNKAKLIDDHLLLSNSGDFLVSNKYTVEIGGKNKSFEQIKDIPNSFVVVDNIEIGYGAKIPLWLFGFLY
jgi:predicted AAA+ superfamily ATPase